MKEQEMNLKRNRMVLAVVALGAAVAGCDKGKVEAPVGMAASVTVVAAVAQDVPIYLDEIGRAVPVQSVTIIPQVGGKIIAQHVEDGAVVKKGDLLFEIDPRPLKRR